MDASNLIKPVLANGELRCIGSTTYQEYRGIFEKDHALARRFQKIDVVEPSVAETMDILRGLKSRFEEHHGVTLCGRRAGRRRRAGGAPHQRPPPAGQGDRRGRRGRRVAAAEAAPPSAIPNVDGCAHRGRGRADRAHSGQERLDFRPRGARRTCERNLKLVIFGQDDAIDALAAAIKMARSGLGDERQPVGSFLFAGPTGVGKTEVTRQLAHRAGRRVPALRHVRVHGAAHGVAPDRRAARLRGLRPGRPADRGHHQAAALRAAAR